MMKSAVLDEKQNVTVLQNLYAAFNRGEIAKIVHSCANNVEWQCYTPMIALHGLRRGHAGVQKFFEDVAHTLHFSKFEPKQYLTNGDTVVVLGTDRAKILEIGKTLDGSWVHVWKMADGKVTSWHGYVEADKILQAFAHHHN